MSNTTEQQATERADLELARFTMDTFPEDETFPGYHNPEERWNGWAVPYFSFEAARAALIQLSEGDPAFRWGFCDECDAFLTWEEFDHTDEPHRWTGERIHLPHEGTTTTLYPVGGCWNALPVDPPEINVRQATFDEAERWGFDGTLRTGGPVYVVEIDGTATLAVEGPTVKVLT